MTRETEQKHTPGPWRDGKTEVLIKGCQRVGLNIAFINTSDPKKGAEAEANARLIAAAPELLEALKMARSDLADFLRARGCEAEGGEQEWLGHIDEAIAKATGATND